MMKALLFLLIIIPLVASCATVKMTSEQMTDSEQMTVNKTAVKSMIIKLNNAYSSKDIETVTGIYSTSAKLMIFGTDSAEVITSFSEWKAQVISDFQLIESIKFGEVRNLSIQISSTCDLAAAVYEVPVDMVYGGQNSHVLFRSANTWIKEKK